MVTHSMEGPITHQCIFFLLLKENSHEEQSKQNLLKNSHVANM